MTLFQVIVLLLFSVLFFFTFSTSEGSEDLEPKVYKCANGSAKTVELCLKKDLLKDYDPEVRPVPHHSNQTTVFMALFPIKISIYSSRSMWTMSWVQKRWVDELLKWDPGDYQNLQQLTINPSSIWQPDLRPLPVKGHHEGYTSYQTATLASSGTVSSIETVHYSANCDSDISRWPYESYVCVLTLQSKAYKGPELNVFIMDHKTPELKYFNPDRLTTLVSMSSARISTESFESKYFVVSLEYTFVIKKNSLMLATTVIFPAVVFCIVQLSFFSLDKESSVRVFLCSMGILTHYFFLSFGTTDVPSEGNIVPSIVKFYKYSLLLSTCVLVWTITVHSLCTLVTFPYCLYEATLRVHNNRFLKYLIPFDGNLGHSAALDTEDASTLVGKGQNENNQWRNMAEFLDRVVFIICVLVYLCLYFAYIP